MAGIVSGVFGCSSGVKKENRAETLGDAKKAYEVGAFSRSEQVLGKILTAAPGNLDALQTMALVQAAQGKNNQAIEQYRRIVEIAPGDHASWYRMALLERVVGKSGEAQTHLEKALEIKPGDRSYTDELARTKMSAGAYGEAATLWGTLLEDEQLTKESRTELLLAQGQAYMAAKDGKSAEQAFAAALKLNPDDKTLQATVKSFN